MVNRVCHSRGEAERDPTVMEGDVRKTAAVSSQIWDSPMNPLSLSSEYREWLVPLCYLVD